MPVIDPIVATLILLLDHVPPDVPSINVLAVPWQSVVVPEIATGERLTDNTVLDVHPVEN